MYSVKTQTPPSDFKSIQRLPFEGNKDDEKIIAQTVEKGKVFPQKTRQMRRSFPPVLEGLWKENGQKIRAGD